MSLGRHKCRENKKAEAHVTNDVESRDDEESAYTTAVSPQQALQKGDKIMSDGYDFPQACGLYLLQPISVTREMALVGAELLDAINTKAAHSLKY